MDERTQRLIDEMTFADNLRSSAREALEKHLVATAVFKVGDRVRQKKGDYSREMEGRVVKVYMKEDYVGYNKPKEYVAYGQCYPIKKDGTTSMKGEFLVTNKNVIVLPE